ncbi:CoA-binding domain protein [Caldalkalibacillus thermarum TA2.A1]|uniref:CoA-binding domain protein n=1 Tax=Caldalkalibacillus thermarum (strain TA2.A1) TaxID=986075 RepID=F5L624_CALTT|nr:CoA-binding protein [Caldalkalibacillus thermarum]EGL83227.1 CoA-binding domain protein [Caldalkalibacillus thermarum TA2.A1]
MTDKVKELIQLLHHANVTREEIKEILTKYKRIAVVGLSDNPHRTSYQVAEYMQQAGYEIIPVNPMITESLGQKAYPSLKDVPGKIDIVNVFRRSEDTVEPAKEAVEIGAKVLWLQLGIVNEEAFRIASEAGLKVIMDRCIKVEHALLTGSR